MLAHNDALPYLPYGHSPLLDRLGLPVSLVILNIGERVKLNPKTAETGYYITTIGRKGKLYWNEEDCGWEGDIKRATAFASKDDAKECAFEIKGKSEIVEIV